jgi:hypothetical protein
MKLEERSRLSLTLGIAVSLTSLIGWNQVAVAQNSRTAIDQSVQLSEPVPTRFISDGSRLVFEQIGLNFTPIEGWEVIRQGGAMTLVMQELDRSLVKADAQRVRFQRNFTIVTKHKALPIDQQAISDFEEMLKAKMAQNSMVTDFQVLENRVFNHQGLRDGILVYSSMKLGEFSIMQAHTLISGSNNHFILSYSDLAERFTSDQETFQKIWTAINTVKIVGKSKHRYFDVVVIGGSSIVLLILFVLINFVRKWRASRIYSEVANSVYDDKTGGPHVSITQSGVWAFDTDDDLDNRHGDIEVAMRRSSLSKHYNFDSDQSLEGPAGTWISRRSDDNRSKAFRKKEVSEPSVSDDGLCWSNAASSVSNFI